MTTMQTKRIRPSKSYELSLPRAVRVEHDGRVSSFWIDGEPLLLQLSSYIREDGRQVMAQDRLRERIAGSSGKWTAWARVLNEDPHVDQAIAEITDEHDILWVHAYLVWPQLAIYVTISGPAEIARDPDNWAMKGLRGLAQVVQLSGRGGAD